MTALNRSFDRRSMLQLGASATALGFLGGGLGMDPATAATSAWPKARLGLADASRINSAQFMSTATLAAFGAGLDRIGLRATGSPVHESYVRSLAADLKSAGLRNVQTLPVPMKQWLADGWSLQVGGVTVPHTFYVPYSKATGAAGVSAPMVYVPIGELLGAGGVPTLTDLLGALDLRGKIAVFEVPYTPLPIPTFEALSYPGGFHNVDGRQQTDVYKRPWFNTIPQILQLLTAAGAVGTVGIWADLPGAWARQYSPYDAVFRPIPGLWVDSTSGVKLKAQAQAGATAKLTLEATVKDTYTHNVIGFIPGRTSDLTVLHTHTDGTNAMEENGQLGILASAQYLARLPRATLERTIMVFFSTGHFAGGVGIRHFLETQAHNLVPKMTSILTLEHLGCLEWLPNGQGQIVPTGRHELGAYFTPNAPGMVSACIAAQNADGITGAVIRPFYPNQNAPKEKVGWPGEGTYFWWYAGLLDANYITGPYGLISADLRTAGMVDYSLMRRKAMNATLEVIRLARTPKAQLVPSGLLGE